MPGSPAAEWIFAAAAVIGITSLSIRPASGIILDPAASAAALDAAREAWIRAQTARTALAVSGLAAETMALFRMAAMAAERSAA